MKKIELLAPAGNLESGLAAISCGADAVYIGAERFGAREAAGNSLADIEKLCAHAHKYWAKVYVTVNTILRDDELAQAQRLIGQAYNAGADGVIIQDAGLLELDLPPIPLIASTQMHNSTPEKVAFLEKAGFDRVILARELSLEQIREIRRQTSVGLEFFVHGALCVCYSGQCYLSYALGGRSANRGQCAQPCRRRYRLEGPRGESIQGPCYLLSLKDLNLSGHLPELLDAGITSFKIEGRLKDRLYVMNIVSYYRQKLDRILNGSGYKKSSSGKAAFDFTPDPNKTFNRGYTAYFLKERTKEIASTQTPTWAGEKIGAVLRAGKDSFSIDSAVQVHNGDGICFFNENGDLQGSHINTAHGKTICPDKMSGIEPGTVIYRNHDRLFLRQLQKSACERKIGVSFTLAESPGGFILYAADEDGNDAQLGIACDKKPAQKKEMALDTIRRQLLKTGETDFSCTDVKINLSEAFFIPVQTLNSLRRGAAEALMRMRLQNRPAKKGEAVQTTAQYPEKRLSYPANVLNKKAGAFYRRHGVTDIEPAAEAGLDMSGRKVMSTKYCIRYQLGLCKKEPALKHAAETLYLVDEDNLKLELTFNCKECIMEISMINNTRY